jgi:UPF0755 protein
MREKNNKKSKIPFIILIILMIFVYISYNYKSCSEKILFSEDILLEVRSGMSWGKILQDQTGCSSWINKLYLRFNPPSFQLQKWTFLIQKWSNLGGMIEQMKKPVNTDIKLTILEGWNIYDIDRLLSEKWLIQKWEFLDYTSKNLATLKAKFPFLEPVKSVEWYLYPDTYFVNPNNYSLEAFTEKMLSNFKVKVVDEIESWSFENLYQVINLASIVEKEEKNSREKSRVAGILEKRIREGWMIGADATVCYPYKLTSDECTPEFIVSHINDKNTYNTRTMIGLPATPIGNPSKETIDAVIDDEEDTPYYFYLHDSKGNIHYAKTNAEHEENKRKYIYWQ